MKKIDLQFINHDNKHGRFVHVSRLYTILTKYRGRPAMFASIYSTHRVTADIQNITWRLMSYYE